MNPGLNLHQLGRVQFRTGRKVELTGKNAIRLFGVEERHSVLAADQRAVRIDLASAALARGAGKSHTRRRQAAPGIRNVPLRQELFSAGQVLPGAFLQAPAALLRKLLYRAGDVRGFYFGDLKHVTATITAAFAAMDFLY